MKLGTLKDGTRDGRLVVVSRDNQRFAPADGIARTLQAALDTWTQTEPALQNLYASLNDPEFPAALVDPGQFHAPLPRAYEWVDGSAFINHIKLVRQARNAPLPPGLTTDPLVYQGGSSTMLAPTDPLPLPDESWGMDFESEICVILDDTPQGTTREEAPGHIRLLLLANDVSLRNLIPAELEKGFGFFQSKPSTAFSPLAVTPDEVAPWWKDTRLHLQLRTWLNGHLVGDPWAGEEMHFSFAELIAHICKTRSYSAGTIVGSGTVSNFDRARGISCLAERRMIEIIESGKPQTPFLKPGDHVEIELFDDAGKSVFGRINQWVTKP